MDTGSMYLICCLGSKMLSFCFVPELKKRDKKNRRCCHSVRNRPVGYSVCGLNCCYSFVQLDELNDKFHMNM